MSENNTSLAQYVNVTEPQIARVLGRMGFAKVDNVPRTAEVVFSKVITFEGLPTIVRVFTGILKATGKSRGPGKDAIRVCLGRKIDGEVRIFKTLEKVKRTGTWAFHLVDRINSIGTGLAEVPSTVMTEDDLLEGRTEPRPAWGDGKPVHGDKLRCPICTARMVGPKPGRNGPFYGCSRFPSCRGARNLADVMREQRQREREEMQEDSEFDDGLWQDVGGEG